MVDGEMIMTSVIDVRCYFLNSHEELRAPNSPRILSCYIEITIKILFFISRTFSSSTYDAS